MAASQIPPFPAQADDPLRYTFVEMLFALAVSQVAMCVSDIIGAPGSWGVKIPGLMHLALGLIVIAASWVGWRHSQSPGMKQQILSVFSLRFVALLMDVLLVVLYFVLVKSVEVEQVGGNPKLSAPSAASESLWLVAIFGTYAVWDLIADVCSPGCIPVGRLDVRVWTAVRIAFVCAFASVVCAALCFAVFRSSGTLSGVFEVSLFDLALLMIVLLFRVLKGIENPLSVWAKVDHCKAFNPPRRSAGNELQWGIALLLLYGAFLYMATSKLPWPNVT